jgi:hypothetical protein
MPFLESVMSSFSVGFFAGFVDRFFQCRYAQLQSPSCNILASMRKRGRAEDIPVSICSQAQFFCRVLPRAAATSPTEPRSPRGSINGDGALESPHDQYGCALETALAQVVQGCVGLGQGVAVHFGAYRHPGGEGEEMFAVLPG